MKLCGAVRFSIRVLRIQIEAIAGELERSTTLDGMAAWKCVRKDRHRGKHRDQDGNEW